MPTAPESDSENLNMNVKKINLSQSTLGRMERGKYNNGVPIATLLDIAKGL